jgi:hypothetical protein
MDSCQEKGVNANLDNAGSLAFPSECYIHDSLNNKTLVWTYHFTNFGTMTPATVELDVLLGGSGVNETTGTVDFNFEIGQEVPSSGQVVIMVPDDFIADDTADILSSLNTFTEDTTDQGGGINDSLAKIQSAQIIDNIITLTLTSTDTLSPGAEITVGFDAGVIDTNPSLPGQYAFGLHTKDSTGLVLDTGWALSEVDDDISIRAIVQEALILTVGNNQVNLTVDPSVNGGRDISQYTTLSIATNAPSYNIETKLLNTNNSNPSLFNPIAGTEIASLIHAAALDNENYFGYSLNTPLTSTTFADKSFNALGTNLFEAAEDGLTNEDLFTIYYDLNVDYLTQAGVYEGMIYYTAVPTF